MAVLNDPKSRNRYDALRARGHSYGRALRGAAGRLLGVACVLLRRRTLRDLSKMFLLRGIVFSHEAVRDWGARAR